jgi:hypothetical protein
MIPTTARAEVGLGALERKPFPQSIIHNRSIIEQH